MKRISLVVLFLVVVMAVFIGTGKCQVPVAITPPPHLQFTDSSGAVLANGFLFTYIAGTTTLSNTYVDSTGTIQNPNPIPLDATGAPSNGSTQTGIWLANQSYKFCAADSNMVIQWCTDNLTGYLGLLNTVNSWLFQQTFESPIVITATDNQIILGAVGNQTTLDAPPPAGNIALHFPNTADTLVGRDTTDTLTHKTLTSPTETTPLVNGITIQNGPATYTTLANANPTGTTTALLVKLANAPSQGTIPATSDTSGVIGVCVLACGNTDTATIQQSGTVSCVFDGATTAGDYVTISTSVAGNCHDVGSTTPTGSQSLGRVLSTNGGGGTYSMNLFSAFATALPCASGTSAIVNPATALPTAVEECVITAGKLNVIGKTFRLTYTVLVSPAGAYTGTVGVGISGTPSFALTSSTLVSSSAVAAAWTVSAQVTCTVATLGIAGTLQCTSITSSAAFGANVLTQTATPVTQTISTNSDLYVGSSCSFGTANVVNSCNNYQLSVELLN